MRTEAVCNRWSASDRRSWRPGRSHGVQIGGRKFARRSHKRKKSEACAKMSPVSAGESQTSRYAGTHSCSGWPDPPFCGRRDTVGANLLSRLERMQGIFSRFVRFHAGFPRAFPSMRRSYPASARFAAFLGTGSRFEEKR